MRIDHCIHFSLKISLKKSCNPNEIKILIRDFPGKSAEIREKKQNLLRF